LYIFYKTTLFLKILSNFKRQTSQELDSLILDFGLVVKKTTLRSSLPSAFFVEKLFFSPKDCASKNLVNLTVKGF